MRRIARGNFGLFLLDSIALPNFHPFQLLNNQDNSKLQRLTNIFSGLLTYRLIINLATLSDLSLIIMMIQSCRKLNNTTFHQLPPFVFIHRICLCPKHLFELFLPCPGLVWVSFKFLLFSLFLMQMAT